MKKASLLSLILFLLIISSILSSCASTNNFAFEKDAYWVEPNSVFSPKIKSSFHKKYTLSSSNTTIATVDGKQVTPLKEGIITLTALHKDKATTTTIYVINKDEYQENLPSARPEYVKVAFLLDNAILASPMSVRKGQAPSAAYNLSIGGYKIDGWYTTNDYTTKYDFNQPLFDNVTVYGRLSIQPPQYSFSKNDEDNSSYITGLVYPNVPYTSLDNLPTKANDGSDIIGIADNAFRDNATIEKVNIPDSYKYIGIRAFENCSNLEQVTISQASQLTTIKNNAFYKCKLLKECFLPSSLQQVGAFAFYQCKSLCIQESLPINLTVLKQYVFADTATKSIDLQYITDLEESAFQNCQELYKVINTTAIQSCKKFAFKNTKAYSSSIEEYKLAYIGTVLVGASTENPFILKSDITLIADEALLDNRFKHIILTIQGDLPAVGANCFNRKMAVVVNENHYLFAKEHWSVYGEQLYTQFEKNDCDILKRTYGEHTYYSLRKYRGTEKHLDLRDLDFDLEYIWQGAFTNNMIPKEYQLKLKTITLGKVKEIRESAINNVDSLLAIIIHNEENDAKCISLESKVSIPTKDILKCYVPNVLLTRYKDNWSDKNIFSNAIITNHLAISIIESVNKAFIVQYLGEEEMVEIPESIENVSILEISAYAFCYNYDVDTVIVNNSITNINKYAFSNTAIQTIVIGDSVEQIGDKAFHNSQLQNITFLSTQPPQMGVFLPLNHQALQNIFVPTDSVDIYKEFLPQFKDKISTINE